MAKDAERKAVIKILQYLGFGSSEIPEEPQKGRRADIRATKDSESFLIEVKTKEDHTEFTAALNNSEDLEVIPYEKQLLRSNTFGKIIREGVDQHKYSIFVNPIEMKSMGGAILYTPK